MNGIIGEFEGISIRRCRCGSDVKVFEEGYARRSLDDDEGIYFMEPTCYTVECIENCGHEVWGYNTSEQAIEAWNAMMED